MPQWTVPKTDADMLDGITKEMERLLPPGTQFVVLSWPESKPEAYHHVINATRPSAIAMLKEATKVLEKREVLGVHPAVAR